MTQAETDLAAAREELQQAQARGARLRQLLERIIQVRAGHGMLEGGETLDEMARLAGEALVDLAERGDNPVWDVVEAAREWLRSMKKNGWAGSTHLMEAVARLNGSAEEKG